MKLQTKQLKRAVRILAPVFNNRRIIPVTGYICIKDGRAIATNSNTTMSVAFEHEKDIMLPYDEISALMKLEVEDSVELNGTQVKTHNDVINLGSIPPVSDFLNIPEAVTTQCSFDVNESFFEAINLASRFMYKGDYRPEITGVGIILGDMLTVASVDNIITMKRNVEITADCISRRIVLQPDAHTFLSNFKEAHVSISNNLMIVSDDTTCATLPLKENTFPDINRVFPEVIEWTCNVDRDDLITHIRRACVIKDPVQEVIEITADKGFLTIKKNNGHQDAEVKCVAEVMIPTKQQFIAGKLLSILDALTGESVEISFNTNHQKAAYIRSERNDDTLFLIMPIG